MKYPYHAAYILIFLLTIPAWIQAADESLIPLEKARVDFNDKNSLQRGAKLYINYCLGCHSMAFLRYNSMAQDIGVVKANGAVDDTLLKKNLIFTGAKVSDAILSAMPVIPAKQWFGVVPPDLTLVARVRGADWIYTYLKSFYVDPKRPLGVNNLVFPDVAMPNVLVQLQGIQEPLFKKDINGKVVNHLVLVEEGTMGQHQFDAAVNDLVNFLAYTARPEQVHREHIGIWVILFLFIFAIAAYLLKREYWKDIH